MRTAGVLLIAVVAAGCSRSRPDEADTLVFKLGRLFGEQDPLIELLDRFRSETGIRVIAETLPASTDLQHQYFVTALDGGSRDIDVLSMDVIWVPEFARAGWLLDLSSRLPPAERRDFFQAPVAACTFEGRLTAVPWYVDAGVLYYRKDLLEKYGVAVPKTFPELARVARRVLDGEKDPQLYGFLWQGKQYEGLVCFALEVLSSFGARALSDHSVDIAHPEAKRALRFLRELVSSGVSPRLVTTSDEESTRRIFGAGRAVFLRNWIYAWSLFEREGSPVRGKVGLASIPPGEKGAGGAVLGGWQLGINRQCRHPEAAWALVSFLTRPENQAFLARRVGYRPSRRSLYLNPDLASKIPILPRLIRIVDGAFPRPVTPLYLSISQILQSEISAVVAGVRGVDEATERARQEMEFVLESLAESP